MTGTFRSALCAAALLCLGCPAPKPSTKAGGGGATSPTESAAPDAAALREKSKQLFGVLPATAHAKSGPASEDMIALGRALYFDERLSKNQDVSCNTCHDLKSFGIDPRGEKTSAGHKGQMGERNSPTVYNAALHFAQFWDGRAGTVEEQATMPVTNPVEMAMPDDASVAALLKSIPGYVEMFQKAFPGGEINLKNAGIAIGAFERGLLTPNARFDQWLGGKDDALTADELEGLSVYLESNCNMCHAGPLLGGNMYQKLGLISEWPGNEDEGRAAHTDNIAETYFFKVPSLRNVTKTGPYLHDGSVADLTELNKMMAKYQLGKEMSDADAKAISAFLATLEGELPPEEYIAKPALPESGPDTPKPDPN